MSRIPGWAVATVWGGVWLAGWFGAGGVIANLMDRGINYFDTAPDYSGASSERALGKAMRGRREQMFIATKFCTPDGHRPAGTSAADYLRAVEASLARLQTDYVDLVHVHSCDRIERLTDPNLHEAVACAALDDGRLDVMMLAYHHGLWPDQAALIQRAVRAGMGVVAMKTLRGAKHRGLLELRDRADACSQAAFKWMLSSGCSRIRRARVRAPRLCPSRNACSARIGC